MNNLFNSQILLTAEEVMNGYKAVSTLYPFAPSVSIWRSWEFAAYRRYTLPEPILDIGCGDGQFFQLVWPVIKDVVGVDIDPAVIKAAAGSGAYREVHAAPAHAMPFQPGLFASAFANCSLEHMDNLSGVLQSIARVLQPKGTFLLSVVTEKFPEWTTLPLLAKSISTPEKAKNLKDEYLSFHHLINPLSPEAWAEQLESAGFKIIDYIPIVPELTGRLFLFLDNLWHIKMNNGEVGDNLYRYLTTFPDFPAAFHDIIRGLLLAEKDWDTGCGAVFYVQKR
jgi:SAM-dependent methyltransferase